MYVKKSSFIICLVLAVLAGFGLCLLVSGLDAEYGLLSGDVSMSSAFRKPAASPEMNAFREKVTNDTTEFNKALESLSVLTSLMAEFDELVTVASVASEGNGELASSLEQMVKIRRIAADARDSGVMALESLEAIAAGKKSSIDYERASQNLSLAFLMVDRQKSVGRQFVFDVDAFLQGKDAAEYKDLAYARDRWAGYCARQAVLNGDKEEIEYWSSTGMLNGFDGSLKYFNMAAELSSPMDVNQMMQSVLPGAVLIASATSDALTPDMN